ncbi:MAG: hypothetical protein U9O97_02955, partial [Elusimicrobiota bacterium]|nr:hypothetical protein [Elusimicrobiota bacterium]
AGFTYAKQKEEIKILSHLCSQNALIKDVKYNEKLGGTDWKPVIYKYPDIFRKDHGRGILIRAGSLEYGYVPALKKLWMVNRVPANFISINMGHILTKSAGIVMDIKDGKLAGMISKGLQFLGEEKVDDSIIYVMKMNLAPENAFYSAGFRDVKIWIDSEKWFTIKAEFGNSDGDITTYEVTEFELFNDKFYFPTEIVRTSDSGKLVFKYKDVEVNTGVGWDVLKIQVPAKTEVEIITPDSPKKRMQE